VLKPGIHFIVINFCITYYLFLNASEMVILLFTAQKLFYVFKIS